ncbi:unnamed protein product [Ranitomeya imitator]|uniref:THUMP domain-containing protein n=1 Tax=Ranitomeya imitator TaxID=111125 RepID=A0ABN9LK48_9NEOB|nr:unnamed protein product [Ranitomeya imitator]
MLQMGFTDRTGYPIVTPTRFVSGLVGNLNPENKVDLTNPEFTIVVKIIRNVCCLSVVKGLYLVQKEVVKSAKRRNHRNQLEKTEEQCKRTCSGLRHLKKYVHVEPRRNQVMVHMDDLVHDQYPLVLKVHDQYSLVLKVHDQYSLVLKVHDQYSLVLKAHDQYSLVLKAHDQYSLVLKAHDQYSLVLKAHDQYSLVLKVHDQYSLVLKAHDQYSLVLKAHDQYSLVLKAYDQYFLVLKVHDQYSLVLKALDQSEEPSAANPSFIL